MSLARVQELAEQFSSAVVDFGRAEQYSEREHFEAMLAGIQALATALTPLVGYIAEKVGLAHPAWNWEGVYLPSCSGYLFASGKIYLPPLQDDEPINPQRDVRNVTDTVVELIRRIPDWSLDNRETAMHGLFVSLNQALKRAFEKVEERQSQRSRVAAGIQRDIAALTPSRPGRSLG